MPSEQSSNAGIVTDTSGERHIPESVRADGTTRKAIRVKPGYRPPEDVEVYKNRTAKSFQQRKERIGIPGAAGIQDDKKSSAASDKNAKRRDARKKAKDNEKESDVKDPVNKQEEEREVDPEAEKEKKARNLKKKLKQAKDLQDKKEGGEALLPEQIAKVIKINELVRELEALGFDSEGQPKEKEGVKGEKD